MTKSSATRSSPSKWTAATRCRDSRLRPRELTLLCDGSFIRVLRLAQNAGDGNRRVVGEPEITVASRRRTSRCDRLAQSRLRRRRPFPVPRDPLDERCDRHVDRGGADRLVEIEVVVGAGQLDVFDCAAEPARIRSTNSRAAEAGPRGRSRRGSPASAAGQASAQGRRSSRTGRSARRSRPRRRRPLRSRGRRRPSCRPGRVATDRRRIPPHATAPTRSRLGHRRPDRRDPHAVAADSSR